MYNDLGGIAQSCGEENHRFPALRIVAPLSDYAVCHLHVEDTFPPPRVPYARRAITSIPRVQTSSRLAAVARRDALPCPICRVCRCPLDPCPTCHPSPLGSSRAPHSACHPNFMAMVVMVLWLAAVSCVSCRQTMSALDVSTCLQSRLNDVTLAHSTISGPWRGWMSQLWAKSIFTGLYINNLKPLCIINRAHNSISAATHHCPRPRLHCLCPRPLRCLPRFAEISMVRAWPAAG